jgi:hypothetical protein
VVIYIDMMTMMTTTLIVQAGPRIEVLSEDRVLMRCTKKCE